MNCFVLQLAATVLATAAVAADTPLQRVPVAYHVLKGITHYGIYREGFEEATRLELEWFIQHLKKQP